jgi:hypothetical protein
MNAAQRMQQYLRAQIADKERERIAIDAEISALQSMRSILETFQDQEAEAQKKTEVKS